MFGKKKDWMRLAEALDVTNRVTVLEDNYNNLPSVISCDKCKHLIYKKDAIKGESRVVKERESSGWREGIAGYEMTLTDKEVIKEVFHCPNCAPKKEKNGVR